MLEVEEDTTDEFLTVSQAVATSGKTESGIRHALRVGTLPFTMRYGVKVIARADLAAYCATVKMGRPKKDKTDNKPAA